MWSNKDTLRQVRKMQKFLFHIGVGWHRFSVNLNSFELPHDVNDKLLKLFGKVPQVPQSIIKAVLGQHSWNAWIYAYQLG